MIHVWLDLHGRNMRVDLRTTKKSHKQLVRACVICRFAETYKYIRKSLLCAAALHLFSLFCDVIYSSKTPLEQPGLREIKMKIRV